MILHRLVFHSLVLLGAVTAKAHGQTEQALVKYGGGLNSVPSEVRMPIGGDHCSAGELTPGLGYEASPTEVKPVEKGSGLVVIFAAPGTGETPAESAVKEGQYLQFKLNAEEGKQLNIMGFSARVWSGSNGKRKFSVYATPRGGAASNETVAIVDGREVPTSSALRENPGLIQVEANLADLPAFKGIDGLEVKLVFHGYGSNPNGDPSRSGSYIDEITVTGTVH